MFKRTNELTDEERSKVSKMCGNIMLWIMEGRSLDYMAKELKIERGQVHHNINEILYILRNQVGRKRYFRILFTD